MQEWMAGRCLYMFMTSPLSLSVSPHSRRNRPGSDVGAVLTRLLELCPVGPIPPHVLLAKVGRHQS